MIKILTIVVLALAGIFYAWVQRTAAQEDQLNGPNDQH